MAGLNRDLLNLNKILKFHRGQEQAYAATTSHAKIPATALPSWISRGARCCYVSKSSGSLHKVKVQKIDEKQQMVTVVFEEDTKSGKRVPFAECSKTNDGTLRPVFKSSETVATCAAPPERPATQASSSATTPDKTQPAPVVEAISSEEENLPGVTSTAGNSKTAATTAATTPGLFVPRAVALGSAAKAPSTDVPMGPMPKPAEISDDEIRRLGEGHFQAMMRSQQEKIVAALKACDFAPGIGWDRSFQAARAALDSAVQQAASAVEGLSAALPTQVLHEVAGLLLGIICRDLLSKLLRRQRMDNEEVSNASALLLQASLTMPRQILPADCSLGPDDLAPGWPAFALTAELLGASLSRFLERRAELLEALTEDELLSLLHLSLTDPDAISPQDAWEAIRAG